MWTHYTFMPTNIVTCSFYYVCELLSEFFVFVLLAKIYMDISSTVCLVR